MTLLQLATLLTANARQKSLQTIQANLESVWMSSSTYLAHSKGSKAAEHLLQVPYK